MTKIAPLGWSQARREVPRKRYTPSTANVQTSWPARMTLSSPNHIIGAMNCNRAELLTFIVHIATRGG
jgi:hypothetical protein